MDQESPETERNFFIQWFLDLKVHICIAGKVSLDSIGLKMDAYLYAWVPLLTWRSGFSKGSLRNGEKCEQSVLKIIIIL